MLLRDFKPADLKTLHAIDAACFPPGISYSLGELAAFIHHRRSKTWVAEEAGQIAGFLVAQRTSAEAAHIVTIDVVKEARRRGVGAVLMEAAEAWARQQGCQIVSLETAEDNRAAQAFYKELGYEKRDQIEGYYDDGTAAWVMTKSVR